MPLIESLLANLNRESPLPKYIESAQLYSKAISFKQLWLFPLFPCLWTYTMWPGLKRTASAVVHAEYSGYGIQYSAMPERENLQILFLFWVWWTLCTYLTRLLLRTRSKSTRPQTTEWNRFRGKTNQAKMSSEKRHAAPWVFSQALEFTQSMAHSFAELCRCGKKDCVLVLVREWQTGLMVNIIAFATL